MGPPRLPLVGARLRPVAFVLNRDELVFGRRRLEQLGLFAHFDPYCRGHRGDDGGHGLPHRAGVGRDDGRGRDGGRGHGGGHGRGGDQ